MASRFRLSAFFVHGLLTVPAMVVLVVALLALLLGVTGAGGDPHGFATAFALAGGVVVLVPSLAYLWLVRRWWSGRGAMALMVADLALAILAVAAFLQDMSPGQPWVAVVYGALAAVAASMLWIDVHRSGPPCAPRTVGKS
jgi:hypothetical protein